jgi:FkbM family methyltransferase
MKILDIGANDGWWYLENKSTYPNAKFTLVEANPYNEEALAKLNVEYYISCLSDEVKTVEFYTTVESLTSTGASYYKENTDFFSTGKIKTLKLKTTTLDLLFSNEVFDIIKMDVQGAEVDIIKGGPKLISKASKILLEVPVQGIEYNIGAPGREVYFKVMQDLGFNNYEIVANINNLQEDILFTR